MSTKIETWFNIVIISTFLILLVGCSDTSRNGSSENSTNTQEESRLAVSNQVEPTQQASKGSTRIKFAKGATSEIVTGKLDGFDSEQSYIIEVGKGQVMKVKQLDRKENQYVSIFINAPGGENANDMDLSCHSNATVSPTSAGDYSIKVTECLKADPWTGDYRLKITVQ